MNPTWINNYRNAKRRSAELSFGGVSDSLIAAGASTRQQENCRLNSKRSR